MVQKEFYAIPVIGAMAFATATILEKLMLKRKETSVKSYQVMVFFSITLLMIPLLFVFWKPIPHEAFAFWNILIFLGVVVISVFANKAMFFSLKWEKVSNLEPAKILEPLFVVILAIIFSFVFGQDLYARNFKVIIPAIIAGIALVVSHLKKHHLTFNKYFLSAILASFLYATELILSRLILDYYTPISFYFFRVLFIFVISIAIFRPKIVSKGKKMKWTLFFTAITWVIYRITIYYGYIHLGVISTTLLIMLGPIFTYIFAYKFLNEKISLRNIISAIVIVASVLYGILA